MKKSEFYKSDNFENNFVKYGIIILVVVAFATLVAIPLFANAACEHGHWDKSKRSEFLEKRQNALHDKLGLSVSQEVAWNDFIVKSKPIERPTKPAWSELSKLSMPDRLDHMLVMKKDRLQAMESRVTAVKTFYAQLSLEQKKIFDESIFHHKNGQEWHHEHE